MSKLTTTGQAVEPVKAWGTEETFTTQSSAETIALGRKLAAMLAPPKLMILRGDLGAGKTTIVKGIAEALGAAEPEEVTSPTFTLIHEYEGKSPTDGREVLLYHLDLYRLEGERQLDTLGLDELLTDESVVLIEWGEKFQSIVKKADGEIVMTAAGGDARTVVIRLK